MGIWDSFEQIAGVLVRLKQISDRIKDAEILSVFSDMNLAMSNLKRELADERNALTESQTEKKALESRIRTLEAENSELALRPNLPPPPPVIMSIEESPHYENAIKILKYASSIDASRQPFGSQSVSGRYLITVPVAKLAISLLRNHDLIDNHGWGGVERYSISHKGREFLFEKGLL